MDGDKPLLILRGDLKTPPMSREARMKVGFLLRKLQQGEVLSHPQSRPMPGIGARCHELRVNVRGKAWRVVYRIDEDAIIVVDVFMKKTKKTPKHIVDSCKARLAHYDSSYDGD